MKRTYLVAAIIIIIALVGGTVYGLYFFHPDHAPAGSKLQVVAAENFWGSLITQLGKDRVQVLSIVTDPNADPHDYESSTADARAIADANLVIVNGAGYDDWALHLIQASNTPGQTVLNVADLLGRKEGDNPHFWYSPSFVNQTIHAMYSDLVSNDPSSTTYYRQQYTALNVSLGAYNSRINEIRQKFHGVLVASTESIFKYLADATSLNLISPPDFMKAVAEGYDPSAQSQAIFVQQIQNATSPGNATVLVYNQQTPSPLTIEMRATASHGNIPVVPVTETIQPPDLSFEEWMFGEVNLLENALTPLSK